MGNFKDKIILAIETSCDDTGIALLKATENKTDTEFEVLANEISSQIEMHRQYGGVFPAMAKREHAKNIVPLFIHALKQAKLLEPIKSISKKLSSAKRKKLEQILEREPEVFAALLEFLETYEKPALDQITVTTGPGLEPTLWVGINFARALGYLFDLPIIPANHMEGHILSVAISTERKFKINSESFDFPMLALLVSGGHTELVLAKDIGDYQMIGATRDDAAGEAFDKIARMMELPYPGGPEIAKLAKESRDNPLPWKGRHGSRPENIFSLPRPMLHSKDFDFSFSGLKTAVLYLLQASNYQTTEDGNRELAREVEDAIVEVLVAKTVKAGEVYKAKSIVVGGGVSANEHLRNELAVGAKKLRIKAHFPTRKLSTDNALMIALAGYLKSKRMKKIPKTLKAEGDLKLG